MNFLKFLLGAVMILGLIGLITVAIIIIGFIHAIAPMFTFSGTLGMLLI